MARQKGKYKPPKRKGWCGNKSRRYVKKEYFSDVQLRQADENWIVANYNQKRHYKSGNMVAPIIVKKEYHDNREIAQAISHSYINMHPIFDQLDNLYEYVSKKSDKVLTFHESFRDLIYILQEHIWWFKNQEFILNFPGHLNTVPDFQNQEFRQRISRHFILPPEKKSVDSNFMSGTAANIIHRERQVVEGGTDRTILLAFSGGRGSLATALFYKDHGYDVRLFHVCGINRAYGDEYKYAKMQAERLELPLYVYNIQVNDGYYDDYAIHPLRNIVIANAMIHFAIIHQLPPNVAFGTFEMDRLAYNQFNECGGDCREMWDAYTKIIQQIIPYFRVRTPLSHAGAALDRLMMNPSYFDMVTFCATELQYRGRNRRHVERFFKVPIKEQSCGNCWKCAADYIYKCDHNMEEPDYHYYIICMTILKAQFDGERGYPCFNIYDIWNRYFYYNIAESKFHEELRKAVIRETGNISFPNHVVEDYYKFKSFKRVSSIIYKKI